MQLTLVLEIPEQVRVRIQAVSHYAGELSGKPDIHYLLLISTQMDISPVQFQTLTKIIAELYIIYILSIITTPPPGCEPGGVGYLLRDAGHHGLESLSVERRVTPAHSAVKDIIITRITGHKEWGVLGLHNDPVGALF